MKKFGKYLLLLISVVVIVFSLTACTNYDYGPVSGGEPNAMVESNGGQVVKQGNTLYFVNGKTDENAYNKFGEVVKGGVYRATIKDNGLTDIKRIVPKNVYTTGKDAGIYIFGNYMYYLTPCDDKDASDKPLNNTADVMRVKIDGTETVKLGYLDALDYQYKFINGYFIYYKNNVLKICKAVEDLPVVKTIKNVTGLVMPKTDSYEKNKEYVTDYIFYTRNLTEEESEDGSTNNMLCAIKCDGTNEIEIVNKTTTFKEYKESQKDNSSVITLKDYLVVGNNLTIYYTRKDAGKNASLSEKLYSYTFTVDSLKAGKDSYFDKAKEVLIYDQVVNNLIPYTADSVLEIKDKTIYLYKAGKVDNVTFVGVFPGSLVEVRKEGNNDIMYYTTSEGLFKFTLAQNNVIVAKDEQSFVQIYDGSVSANVFGNEFIGDYFYFNDSIINNYVVRVDVNKIYSSDKDSKLLKVEQVCKMTNNDQKAYDEANKKEEDK